MYLYLWTFESLTNCIDKTAIVAHKKTRLIYANGNNKTDISDFRLPSISVFANTGLAYKILWLLPYLKLSVSVFISLKWLLTSAPGAPGRPASDR